MANFRTWERERERFIFQAMEFVQQDKDKQKFAGTNQTYNKITQIKHITNNTEPSISFEFVEIFFGNNCFTLTLHVL